MSRDRRLVAIFATITFAVPYLQQGDLITLYAMPVGQIGWLGNLGYIMLLIWPDTAALRWLFIVPLIVYVWILREPFKVWWAARNDSAAETNRHEESASS